MIQPATCVYVYRDSWMFFQGCLEKLWSFALFLDYGYEKPSSKVGQFYCMPNQEVDCSYHASLHWSGHNQLIDSIRTRQPSPATTCKENLPIPGVQNFSWLRNWYHRHRHVNGTKPNHTRAKGNTVQSICPKCSTLFLCVSKKYECLMKNHQVSNI